MKTTFNILAIDGGGIRGIIPAKLLSEVERELAPQTGGKSLYQHFDLICGTSTGAILTIGIALGIPADELLNFYKKHAKVIFPKWYLKVLPRTTRVLINSIYSNRPLQKKLEEVFTKANNGKLPLMHDLKTNVCIPSFNGNEGEINVFKTKHHIEYNRDFKLPAHQVALASASAPVYFPPHSFAYDNEFGKGHLINMIDGGLFANNPSLVGILEATDKLQQPVESIRLLSLGTGKGKHIIKKRWAPHNFFYWFAPKPRLLDITLDSQAQITEQYVNFLQRVLENLGKGFKYRRIQYDFGDETVDLNASHHSEIERLDAIGGELSKKNLSSIIKFITE